MIYSSLLRLLASGYNYSRRTYILSLALSAIFGLTVPLFIQLQRAIIDTAVAGISVQQMMWVLLPAAGGYLVCHWIDAVSADVNMVVNAKTMHNVEKRVMRDYLDEVSHLEFQAFGNVEIQKVLMRLSQTQKDVYYKTITFLPNIIRRLIELAGIFYFVAISGVWWAFPLGIVISLPYFYFNRKRIEYALQGADLASANFLKMPPSVKRTYTAFYLDAKREDVRMRCLEKIIERLNANKRPM